MNRGIRGGSRGGAREGPGPRPPLFWVKKEKMTEGKRPPPPLAQGLDPPLGMQIHRSVPFFLQIHRSAKIFCLNPKPELHPKTEVQQFKGKLVHVNAMLMLISPKCEEGNMLPTHPIEQNRTKNQFIYLFI